MCLYSEKMLNERGKVDGKIEDDRQEFWLNDFFSFCETEWKLFWRNDLDLRIGKLWEFVDEDAEINGCNLITFLLVHTGRMKRSAWA